MRTLLLVNINIISLPYYCISFTFAIKLFTILKLVKILE